MIYRICTENKNKEYIENLVADQFVCFSIFEGIGYWLGTRELSLCIEIDIKCDERSKVVAIAENIKKHNNQEAVLVQEIKSNSILI